MLASRHAAGESAGHLERRFPPGVGRQVHHQHQHGNELLVRGGVQPVRDAPAAFRPLAPDAAARGAGGAGHVRRERLGGAPQHRPVGRLCAAGHLLPRDILADGRGVAVPAHRGALPLHAGCGFPACELRPDDRRGGFLPRHRDSAGGWHVYRQSVVLAGERVYHPVGRKRDADRRGGDGRADSPRTDVRHRGMRRGAGGGYGALHRLQAET